MDFSSRFSNTFGLIYCLIIYGICLVLPSPRTASVAYEMTVAPYFNFSSLVFSFIYFVLTLIVVLNRSKIIEIIGEYLTPVIIIIIIALSLISFFMEHPPMLPSSIESPFAVGFLEGYQTFDAIAGIVVGAVLVVSIDLRNEYSYAEKRNIIIKSGLICGFSLFLIYTGLTLSGALFGNDFTPEVKRTDLLSGIGLRTLGNFGNLLLVTLVSLACFTTAVGIVAGASDFVKKVFNNSNTAYRITAIAGCFFGMLIGQLEFDTILKITVPFLLFIYPITILLIFLNNVPHRWASFRVFAAVLSVGFIFGIYDTLKWFGIDFLEPILQYIPLQQYSLAWLAPALSVWILTIGYEKITGKTEL